MARLGWVTCSGPPQANAGGPGCGDGKGMEWRPVGMERDSLGKGGKPRTIDGQGPWQLCLGTFPCQANASAQPAPATAWPRRGAGAGPSSCSCVHWAGPSPSRPRSDQSSLVTPAGWGWGWGHMGVEADRSWPATCELDGPCSAHQMICTVLHTSAF